jgi:hypothetical protein
MANGENYKKDTELSFLKHIKSTKLALAGHAKSPCDLKKEHLYEGFFF